MQSHWNAVALFAAVLLAACSDAGRELPASSEQSGSAASTPVEGGSSAVPVSEGTAVDGDEQERDKGLNEGRPASASASAAAPVQPVVSPEEQARLEKQLWLESPLYGSDNHMARARRVTITPLGDDGYRVLIANQMSFECDLAFNSRGQPARMAHCAPKLAENSEWKVVQKEVPLHCSALATEVVCSGEYDLGMPAGGTFPGRMTIARKR